VTGPARNNKAYFVRLSVVGAPVSQSMITKLTTGLRLARAGEWALLRRRWSIQTAAIRVRCHRSKPFVNRDLGFRAVCHPDWPDSLDQFLTQSGDRWEFALLAHWLQEGDLVFDVGTNLGLYACASIAAVGGLGKIVAVDADAYVVGKLREAATMLGVRNLEVVHTAVTDQEGSVTFFVHEDNLETGAQSLRPADDQLARSRRVTVPASTMAGLQRHGAGRLPAVVKVDIEGAEGLALTNTPAEWLHSDGPLWIVEVNPSALAQFGATPHDILHHFSSDHFDRCLLPKHPVDLSQIPSLRPLNPDESFDDSIYYNLIAVPRGPASAERRRRVQRLLHHGID